MTIYGKCQIMSVVKLLEKKATITRADYPWARIMLPYEVRYMSNKSYLLLNRNYNPLGLGDGISIHEEFKIFYLNEDDLYLDDVRHSRMYLFNDGNPPWGWKKKSLDNYRIRLHKLLKLDRPTRLIGGLNRVI